MNSALNWGLGIGLEHVEGANYLWQWGDNGGWKNFILAHPPTRLSGICHVFVSPDRRVHCRSPLCSYRALRWIEPGYERPDSRHGDDRPPLRRDRRRGHEHAVGGISDALGVVRRPARVDRGRPHPRARRDRVRSYLTPLREAGELPTEGEADLRYVGQSFELTVPLQPALEEAFHRAHEARYGYADRDRSIPK